jgi:hypothetical protein
MGTMRRTLCAIAAAVAVAGCASQPPAREAAAIGPKLVSRPTPEACTESTLERAAPWIGKVTLRQPIEVVGELSSIVRREWVLCGKLDEAACEGWAQDTAAKRANGSELMFEIAPGKSNRGKLWAILVDGREEAHLFQTNKDFVTFFRKLARDGKEPSVVGADRVVESRYGRVEIDYRTAWTVGNRPAMRWQYEIANDTQSLVEAGLAFEDLELQGIELTYESWSTLHQAARGAATNTASYPELSAEPPRPDAEPVTLWLEARCITR